MSEPRDPFIDQIAAELKRPVRLDPRFDERVMEALNAPDVIPLHPARQAGKPGTRRPWLVRPWTLRVSPITFGALSSLGVQVAAVSEAQVREAVRWAFGEHGLTVEPGGAVALATVLSGIVPTDGGTVIVLSGGNVDPALHAELVI